MDGLTSYESQRKNSLKRDSFKDPFFIKVRCPQCVKLFSVDENEILETHPQFKCTSCKTFFWISYPDCLKKKEVLGFPLEHNTLSQKETLKTLQKRNLKKKPLKLPRYFCPDCHASYKWGDEECVRCGLIFSHFRKTRKRSSSTLSVSSEVKQIWEDILIRYENEDLHYKFLKFCQSEGNLDYAASRYKTILEAQPHDAVALKAMEQIKTLTSLPFVRHTLSTQSGNKGFRPWNSLLLSLSLGLIITGFVIAPLRNFVGLGAALAFFSLSLRYYFQRIL